MQHISIRKHLGCLGYNKYHKNMNKYYLASQIVREVREGDREAFSEEGIFEMGFEV